MGHLNQTWDSSILDRCRSDRPRSHGRKGRDGRRGEDLTSGKTDGYRSWRIQYREERHTQKKGKGDSLQLRREEKK